MVPWEVLALLWDVLATIALLASVALACLSIWSVFRWWDDWQFKPKAPPSVEGRFIAGKEDPDDDESDR